MKRRIDEVARFTRRPREVAEFYAGILDQPLPRDGSEVFNFKVEGVNLFVHLSDEAPPEPGWPPGVDHIALEVEDLDEECERLRRAGYEVEGPRDFPWGRSAYVNDPDGRLVELHGSDVKHDQDRNSPQD